MKFKKMMAILMAAAITVSAGASIVSAETYSETEKAGLADWVKNYCALYQKQMDEYGDTISAKADIYAELTDTSRALLGMFVPVDISWLNNAGFLYNVTMVNGTEAVVGNLYLNDAPVCSLEVYMDTQTQQCYIRIPELHDAYLFANLELEVNGDEATAAALNVLNDPMALMPEASELEALLIRYGNIVLDGFAENITAEDTISVEGIEEACTTYEGRMYQTDAKNFVKELLTTAKDDAELKTFIEEWAPLMEIEGETDDIYQEFQAEIDELLADLDSEDFEEDGSYVSSKIWVDADKNVVGREIGFYENAGAESEIYFKMLSPASDTAAALSVEVYAEGESFGISGQGTVTDGKLSGTYDFLYNDVVMASADVTDYVPADMESGAINGSYKLYLQPGIGEEEYASLSSFDVVVDCTTDMATMDQVYDLTLNMSGSALGTVGITAGYSEPNEVPDFAALTNVLDSTSEEDMVAFVTEMDWAPILDKCKAAGMPEEVASMLDQLIYDALYGVEETTEDFYVDEPVA